MPRTYLGSALAPVMCLVLTACSASEPAGTPEPTEVGARPSVAAETHRRGEAPAPPTISPNPRATMEPEATVGGGGVDPAPVRLSGTWAGTGCRDGTSAACDLDLRLVFLGFGDAVRADAVFERGGNVVWVDQSLRGTRDGDSLTLMRESNTVRTVYEGTVVGDTFSGTITGSVDGVEGLGGPGRFEVTRQP